MLARIRGGFAAAVVGAYAFLDDLLLGPIVVALAVWLPWYLVLALAAAAFSLINVACCNWLQARWDTWLQWHGAKLERRLGRLQRSRILRHPFGWIARDSPLWFTIAAGLIGTVIAVAVARVAGTKEIGHRRVVVASIAYSIGFAATYTGLGVGLEDLISLL